MYNINIVQTNQAANLAARGYGRQTAPGSQTWNRKQFGTCLRKRPTHRVRSPRRKDEYTVSLSVEILHYRKSRPDMAADAQWVTENAGKRRHP
jgi:hypothetical protein